MVVSGTASVGNLVWAKDPEELLKINEQKFKELGVGADTVKALYLSKGFSLSLHTRFATNLYEVRVPGCGDYVATAAESDTEREALFFVESTEMLARFHKTAPVVAVLPDSRALVAKTKDGKAVVMLPVDWVSWTEAYEKALGEVEKRAKAELGATKLELRMTGTMSAGAKKEMAARGWSVVENVPSTFEVAQSRQAAVRRRNPPGRVTPWRGPWPWLALPRRACCRTPEASLASHSARTPSGARSSSCGRGRIANTGTASFRPPQQRHCATRAIASVASGTSRD
jgi:hypothetical protein